MTSALYLYTTLGCHLCEQAEDMLGAVLLHVNRQRSVAGLPPLVLQPVEIAQEHALVELYGLRIPVLRMQDQTRELNWPFDQAGIFAFLMSSSD